jgi:hypothetical protein
MPILVLLVVPFIAVAEAPAAPADEVMLRDGRRVPAALHLDHAGRLHFSAADRSAVPVDRVEYFRLALATVVPFRAGAVHQVELTGAQRLTGGLLGLDGTELRLRTPWRDRLTVPRGRLLGVANLPGTVIALDDDFEDGLKAWKLTGAPQLTTREHTSGKHALLLDAPGQAAKHVLPAPLEAGSVAINLHVPESLDGARWQLEAVFGTPAATKMVRVTVADSAMSYAAEVPVPRDGGVDLPRHPGWHRLVAEFDPTRLVVTIDDLVLWYSKEVGVGGPLREVRLTCTAGKGSVRGAVAFDEFTITRQVEVLARPAAQPTQDEVWLALGDQIFGRLTRLERRGLTLDGRLGQRIYTWDEARGAFLARVAAPPVTSEGAHVRLWLRPAAGSEPDELEGVLRAIGERQLTLRHPALGDLDIERGRLLRLKPLFHGKRIELENGIRQLGERAEYTFSLQARPETARLRLNHRSLGGHADLIVNGRVVEDLGRHADPAARTATQAVVPLPRDCLRVGENKLEVRLRDEARRPGGYVISDVAVELTQ